MSSGSVEVRVAVATCHVAVWLLIVGSSLLMTAAMFLLISVLDRRLLATTRDTGDRFSLGQLVWFIWSALVKQGSVLAPRGDVSRCQHTRVTCQHPAVQDTVRDLVDLHHDRDRILHGAADRGALLAQLQHEGTKQATCHVSDVTYLQVNNLRELHGDPGARWLAQAGGSTQTILATWPEFSFLRPDLHTGKGRFVASLEEARAALDSSEEEHYLVDVFTAAVTVYKDYMSGGGGGHHCKYTYTHKGGGSRV